ncbi:Hypothetical protein SCF082_LOCUS6379 [Durusdinium trenchii]|uniref:Uncharacterized protein n=1 Tax=Durusdinium trenchii TaxID=1381693 RepID=A0ABP0IC68_9DINO
MDVLAEEGRAKISSFNDQALANTAWAFVTLSSRKEALLSAAAAEIERRAHALDSQNLSMVAWTFGDSEKAGMPLINAIALRAVEILQLPTEGTSLQEAYMAPLTLAYAFTRLSESPSSDVPAAAARELRFSEVALWRAGPDGM